MDSLLTYCCLKQLSIGFTKKVASVVELISTYHGLHLPSSWYPDHGILALNMKSFRSVRNMHPLRTCASLGGNRTAWTLHDVLVSTLKPGSLSPAHASLLGSQVTKIWFTGLQKSEAKVYAAMLCKCTIGLSFLTSQLLNWLNCETWGYNRVFGLGHMSIKVA